MLKLIIEDDEGRKTVVPFVRDEITIGRQEGNTIRLTERNVSRRHAKLLRSNGHVLIEDLGSYNGIRINGDRISGQVQVADGDLIQIGDYDLALQAEEAQAATVPLSSAGLGETRKLAEHAPTMPALPAVQDVPEARDEDVEDSNEVGRDTPQSVPRHQSTAVIRIDQVESNRKRPVEAIELSEAPRLVVLNTDLAGREYPCTNTELKIGRTDDNDIAIDHRSLSRTHCKLVREATGEWRVIDLQSANGLMVNGESYAQVTLRPGDVIELGHVKLKFVGPGDQVAIAPSASSSVTGDLDEVGGSRTPLIAVSITVLVILLGGGGYVLWKSGQPATAPKNLPPTTPIATRPTPPEPAKTDPAVDTAADDAKALEAAKANVEQARAAAAAMDFNKAELLARDAKVKDAPIPEATAFLAQLDSERANHTALQSAEKLMAAGDLDKAKTQLDTASGTKLLRAKYEALENERAKAVTQKLALAKEAAKKNVPEKVEPPAPTATERETEALYAEGSTANKAQRYHVAIESLEKCLKLDPRHLGCRRLLGSAYASQGYRDSSNDLMDKARRQYEEYLKIAPPSDPYYDKIKKFLNDAQ